MAKDKVHKVMSEFKAGTLHSGSSSGPRVTSRPQAIAIGLSEARKAGENVGPAPKTKARRAKRKSRSKGPKMSTVYQGGERFRDM